MATESRVFSPQMPPSNNVYYRSCRGNTFVSSAGKVFKRQMALLCANVPRIDGPVAVTLRFHWPTARTRDLDNYFKATLDATKDRMFEDDTQVMVIDASKSVGVPPYGFLMIVKPHTGTAAGRLIINNGATVLRSTTLPPSNNVYYRHCRGRTFIAPEGVAFKKLMCRTCRGQPLLRGPVTVQLQFFWHTRHVRDLDNYFKAIFDATKNRLFEDDSQVIHLRARKCIGLDHPDGFEMVITPLLA
jgi:crossover junction endodeoxyribonuclease RusA